MALIVDQQSNLKHLCKICRKGFGCGRALGGHMRAHGIGDDSGHIDDDVDNHASDWEDNKLGGGNNNIVPPTNKRMNALRTNPNRLKSCRVCENCGKQFMSWKSFLEHGKCSASEVDAESLVSSPPGSDDEGTVMTRRGCSNWSKRKRSLRANKAGINNFNSEEEDLANCLMMLSNANANATVVDHPSITDPDEESCAWASKEEERRINTMINFPAAPKNIAMAMNKTKGVANKGLFECKACKKVFNSHQALGGHRASHKKVMGCFARLDHIDDSSQADDDVITKEDFFPPKSTQFDQGTSTTLLPNSRRKSKVHECSICHRVFSSGQALGGHKRSHWITTSNSPADNTTATTTSSLAKFRQFQDHIEQIQQRPKLNNIDHGSDNQALDLKLDLNFPAPADHRRNQVNPSSSNFNLSTEVYYLQPWISVDANCNEKEYNKNNSNNSNGTDDQQQIVQVDNDKNINNCSSSIQNADEEEAADSKMKLAKLSELKDINNGSGDKSSPWLQVGIGSDP